MLTETILIVAVAGLTITLIVLPKNRPLAFALYALLAAYVMLAPLDFGGVRFNLPAVSVASSIDVQALAPVAIVTGVLVAVILIIGGERNARPK